MFRAGVLAALGTMAVKHAIERQARSVPGGPPGRIWRGELLGRTGVSVPPSGNFWPGARRQKWTFGAAVGFLVGGLMYGSPAMAACVAGNPGGNDFICSWADTNIAISGGATNTTVVLQGDTVSGAPGQVSVSTTGTGTLGFALNGASSITSAGGNALTLTTVNGDLSTNPSPPNISGVNGINGVISATNGRGVNAITTGLGSILLNFSAPTLTSTNGDGIHVEKNFTGTGAVTVVNDTAITVAGTDAVAGRLAAGIFATTTSGISAVSVSGTGSVNTTGGGGGILVTAAFSLGSASASVGSSTTAYGGSVTAGANGIVVSSAGGSELVNMGGSITALNGRGISMGPAAFGSSTSVTMNGATLSSTNGDGIFALNTVGSAGAVTIVNNAAITTAGNDPAGHVAAGIFVSTSGFSAPVSVSGTGSINAAGTGIDARMTGAGTLATLSVGSVAAGYMGSITAHNGRGVNATTVGQGDLLVHMSAPTLTSTGGDGIHAEKTFTGSGTVSVVNDTAITVSGTDAVAGRLAAGIFATTTSGSAAVSVSGTGSVNTTGGGDGIVVTAPFSLGSASASVAYGGSVTAGANGIVVSSAGGSELVNMGGSITALNGRGISMGPAAFGSSTSVTMNGATLSSTNGDGIFALNTVGSAGAVTIVNNASITTAGNDPAGHVAAGIFVSTSGFSAPVSVSGTGSINAAGTGIDARMTGAGTLATLSVGSVAAGYMGSITAHNGRGVNATTVGQ